MRLPGSPGGSLFLKPPCRRAQPCAGWGSRRTPGASCTRRRCSSLCWVSQLSSSLAASLAETSTEPLAGRPRALEVLPFVAADVAAALLLRRLAAAYEHRIVRLARCLLSKLLMPSRLQAPKPLRSGAAGSRCSADSVALLYLWNPASVAACCGCAALPFSGVRLSSPPHVQAELERVGVGSGTRWCVPSLCFLLLLCCAESHTALAAALERMPCTCALALVCATSLSLYPVILAREVSYRH